MARYPIGQPVRISTQVRDLTGTLVNPTAMTLTIQKPDATQQAYSSPANDGIGLYHQDVPTTDLTQVGHYAYKWVSTGTGAGVSYGSLDVFDPFDVSVLPLQDAKSLLNIPAATTTYDSELQVWIDTTLSILEKMTGGPLISRSITEYVKAGQGYRTLVLRQRPVVSVTSIVDNASGTALTLTDLDVDTNAGIVRRKLQLPFWARGPYYTVTYTAGWGTAAPPAFGAAARVILAHLWQIERGPTLRPTIGVSDEVTLPGLGYAVPNRAVELMAPFMQEAYV